MNGNPPNQEKLAIVDIPNYYILELQHQEGSICLQEGFQVLQGSEQELYVNLEFRLPVTVSIVGCKVLKLGSPLH